MIDSRGSLLNTYVREVARSRKRKDDNEEREKSSTNPMTHIHMRLGTLIHSLVQESFRRTKNTPAANLQGYVAEIKSGVEVENQPRIDRVEEELVSASWKLMDGIRKELPEGQSHYSYAETRFQKSPVDMEFLDEATNDPDLTALARKSNYENLDQMFRSMLISPEGEVKIGETPYNLKKMTEIVRQAEMKYQQPLPNQIVMEGIYGEQNSGLDEVTIKMMKTLVGMSMHHYLSNTEDGVSFQLIASAAARTDLLTFSAEIGSKADKFLAKHRGKMFGTEMHDIQRLQEKMGMYRELMGYILDGSITTTLTDIKTSTINEISVRNEQGEEVSKRKVGFLTSEKSVDKKYGWGMAHISQAVIQTFFGISRFDNPDETKGLMRMLTMGEQVNQEADMRNFSRFLRVFYKQRFLVARMYYPIINEVQRSDGKKIHSLDFEMIDRARAHVQVDRLDTRVSIRQRLSKYYKKMMRLISEDQKN